MKMTFIGGGNMGEAMLAAVLSKGQATPQTVWLSDIDDNRRRYLEEKYGVAVTGDNRLAAESGEVVVLAIKPQNLGGVMAELKGRLKSGQLVLSIIAGAKLGTLSRGLSHGAIVRAMPNTPARIGEGISVWTATDGTTPRQKDGAAAILAAMGREIYVADEDYLDMATAVSGSGPAYVFLLIESLVAAAVDIGLPPDVALELALQTVAGSGHFARISDSSPAELRKMVTSPGGTTAAALRKLGEGGFSELIKQAVTAAYNRAKELGG